MEISIKNKAKAAAVFYAKKRNERHQQMRVFEQTIYNDPHEDSNWLAYADWLDENGYQTQASRIRWWMGARDHMRRNRSWGENSPLKLRVHEIQPDWVARLFNVENARHVFDKYHPPENDPEAMKAVKDTHHISELFALGLVTKKELDSVRKTARDLAQDDAGPTGPATRGALDSAAWNATVKTTQNAAQDAALNAAESAVWNAARNAAGNIADNTARNAAFGTARRAAENAYNSSQAALEDYAKNNPIPG